MDYVPGSFNLQRKDSTATSTNASTPNDDSSMSTSSSGVPDYLMEEIEFDNDQLPLFFWQLMDVVCRQNEEEQEQENDQENEED